MSAQITLVIENADEVVAALESLGVEASAVIEQVFMAGAKLLVEAANGLAPSPGNEAEMTKRTSQSITVHVGPDTDHWYLLFAETGTQPHEISPTLAQALTIGDGFFARANHTGSVARPFLRPTVHSKGDDVAREIGDGFAEKLEF